MSEIKRWTRVEVTDESGQVVAIEDAMLAGRDIGEREQEAITDSIRTLCGFIGLPDPVDWVQERDTLARRVQEWQPIETAPKDGTIIDVWLGNADRDGVEFYCTPGTKRSSGWRWKDGKFRPVCGLNLVVTEYPTHWMPLPAPPVTGGPR